MFEIIVTDESSICLFGNEGGDYEEQHIAMRITYEHNDCINNCRKCHRKGDCSDFSERAVIHHHIEDIFNGDEIFEDFINRMSGD